MRDFLLKNLNSRGKDYRPDIDGLRAIAVISVIINHFNKNILPGGYLGVDIFFVISGFVITSSLYRKPSKNLKEFLVGFYERRIRRLVPSLLICVLITSVLICFFDPRPNISLGTGLTSLFGISNLFLLKTSTDYFAQSTQLNTFTHTWSLGVEAQFYILFPFLIWFSGFGKQKINGSRNLFLMAGISTIASFISFLHLYPINQPAAYFLMPSRLWEMAAGCLLFIGLQKKSHFKTVFLDKCPSIFFLLLIGVMFMPSSWAAVSIFLVVILTSLLIASIEQKTLIYKILTNPLVVYLGLISYSLYLWHWSILSLSRWTVGIYWWSVPFQVLIIFGFAAASHRWIEEPMRKGNYFARRNSNLIFSTGMIIIVSGVLLALYKPLKGQIYLGQKYSLPPNENSTELNQIANILSKRNYSLAGNSHSDHIIPLLENIFSKRLFHLKKSFPCETFSEFSGPESFRKNCFFNKNSALLLDELNSGDFLIISSRHRGIYKGGFLEGGFYSNSLKFIPNKLSKNSWHKYEIEFWDQVEMITKLAQVESIYVLFIMPLPEFKTHTDWKICSRQWFNTFSLSQRKNQCFYEENEQTLIDRLSNYSYKRIDTISNKFSNFVTLDLSSDFCKSGICKPTHQNSNNYLYVDANHLEGERSVELRQSTLLQMKKKIFNKLIEK